MTATEAALLFRSCLQGMDRTTDVSWDAMADAVVAAVTAARTDDGPPMVEMLVVAGARLTERVVAADKAEAFRVDRGEDYCRKCGVWTPDGAWCDVCRAEAPLGAIDRALGA